MTNDSNVPQSVQRTSRVQFGMVDAAVIRDPSLSLQTKGIYAYLATYCSNVRSAFPSRATIARQVGMSVRTVDAALKAGEAAGLWTIHHRSRDGRHTSNLYELHDLGGGYIVGSGGRGAGAARGGSAGDAPGSAGDAHDLDHVNQTSSIHTTPTSGDAYAAGAPSQAPGPRIHVPKRFDEKPEGDALRYLVGAAVKALQAVGLEPRQDAADRLGASLRAFQETYPDKTNTALASALELTLARAGTDDAEWGWLATADPWAA